MGDKNSMPGGSTNPRDGEKYLEKALGELVRNELGGLSIKLVSTHFKGLPDRLCLLPRGRAFFVELKSKGKKPSRIQVWVHDKIRALGFRVYVVDSYDNLTRVIENERERLT